MDDNTPELWQVLKESYDALTAAERSLVQVYAVLYEPTNRDIARLCWNAAIADPEKLNPLDAKQFASRVKALVKEGVLSQRYTQGAQCHPLLLDIAVREAVRAGRFEEIAQAVAKLLPIYPKYPDGPLGFRQESEFVRELRIALYRQDRREVDALFEDLRHAHWRSQVTFESALQESLTNPFDPDWFNSLSREFFELGLSLVLADSVARCKPAPEAFDILEDAYRSHQLEAELSLVYAEQLWLRGDLQTAADVLTQVDGTNITHKPVASKHSALWGAIAFLGGDLPDALEHYQRAIKLAGKSRAAQAAWFKHPASALFLFALLQENSAATQAEAETYILLIQKQSSHPLKASVPILLSVLSAQQGKAGKVTSVDGWFEQHSLASAGLPALIELYGLYWLDVQNFEPWASTELPGLCQQAFDAGYDWIGLEIADLLAVVKPKNVHAKKVKALRKKLKSLPLISVVERKAAWELSLTALTNLLGENASSPESSSVQALFRLVWRLRFISITYWALMPIEQKLTAKGAWTKGKAIALKRLYGGEIDYLTDQDRQVCNAMELTYEESYYSSSSKARYFFKDPALLSLVGHPLVFWDDAPGTRVEIVAGEPELLVKQLNEETLRLELSPAVGKSDILACKETLTRLKVIEVSANLRKIAEILGPNNQLEVPIQAQEKVLDAIASVASLVTVQSDIGGGEEAEEVPADGMIYVHLLPAGAGLKVSLLVRPFDTGGAYYLPGQGGETVIAEIDGVRSQTRRDLLEEEKNAHAVRKECIILSDEKPKEGEWLIDETSACLTLLLQLRGLGEQITVEWPEGEKLKLSRQLSSTDFRLNIRRQKDWFEASGDVAVSEHAVLDLQQLMGLMSAANGDFIPLGDGEFLTLTEEFRERLELMQKFSTGSSKKVRIHGLAALAMEKAFADMDQRQVDSEWQAHINRIKKACAIRPKVPKTLKATLRDYQTEGYTWLARLANWGVGACLADDMGLGKTLQGLAVILKRCKDGPTLVIAPTSVCLNWCSEAERFAPSLKLHSFGSDQRQQLVDSLGAKDLLVCSYGLLQQDAVADMLAQVTWTTIVLDEAQAIKNPSTLRSRAVMALQGQFKVIMTGTPIENHLGELWNLFQFINPGLLGSLHSFNRRFANPIARENDAGARKALRRLIAPFILRRTKDQVLTELPSRTEITVSVALSEEEMAFYEALRREAIANLKNKELRAGQKHLQVLAEIMRLRRACCNPALVRPELGINSTKLEQFTLLLGELLENGHKALVFSQFVDHLKLLKQHLDKQQIHYQYLDGSTPVKKRKQSVDAFQNGEGDVFLISLKAGGTGLNLTAADYVLHMDPWWNPAVEDQASDRAYRIGQQRPVTIYRLVAKGTIEDKIVSLHKTKRDLADSLLAGSDASGKVSTEQLLSLIQQ
ncbi:MAG: DEAD/DEAH box helicase [Cyanobacteria bacterium J06560_5]